MPPNAPEQNQALFQRNVSLTRAGVVACRTISVRDIRRPVVFTVTLYDSVKEATGHRGKNGPPLSNTVV